jgi:hypothetical protein
LPAYVEQQLEVMLVVHLLPGEGPLRTAYAARELQRQSGAPELEPTVQRVLLMPVRR